MTAPDISIVIPVRDAVATLPECIASICAQTLRHFEVLAVNDGSSDGSRALLADWAARDGRVRLMDAEGPAAECQTPRAAGGSRAGRGKGIVAALNTGLRHARGRYIARMDADDIMHCDRLQAQSDYLQRHPHIDLVASRVALFPEDNIQAGYAEYIRWQNSVLTERDVRDEIYVESPFAHPSVMFRAGVVNALVGYRHGDFAEDYDLWLRMMHAGCRMAKLPQTLLKWRESESRASRTDNRYSRLAFDRLRAHYLANDPRIQQDRPIVYWGAGRKTRKRSNRLVEQGVTPHAWIDIDERKIGNRLNGVRVEHPAWLEQCHGVKPFVLSYVANHGARDLIASQLQAYGYHRGVDFLHVG